MLTYEKVVVHVYFGIFFFFCGLRDFLKAMYLSHSIKREQQLPPGIAGIPGETSFWIGAAKTHGLTESCIIVQYLTFPGMAQRGSSVRRELVDK